MASSKKTVQFGLKNVHYAVFDEEKGTYGKPVAFPGAVKMSVTRNSNTEKFYADDGLFWSDSTSADVSAELEVAFTDDDFFVNVMGCAKDANGVLYEPADAVAKQVALLYEVSSNRLPQRFAFYNAVCSMPSDEHNTRSDSTTPDTVTLPMTVGSQDFEVGGVTTSVVKAHATKGTETDKAWGKWFDQVVVPGATLE